MSSYSFILPNTITARRQEESVDIVLYKNADKLYKELEVNGYIKRLQEIRQLGPVKPKKDNKIYRYDYMFIQLYLHKLIRHMRLLTKYGKNNQLFNSNKTYAMNITLSEALQLLVILYNVGHFYNTFTASRAVILQANKNEVFCNQLLAQFTRQEFRDAAYNMVNKYQYDKWHLLNTYLLLHHLHLSPELIQVCEYLLLLCIANKNNLTTKEQYLLTVFDEIRGIAYAACDLQSFRLALAIDLHSEEELKSLLRELLSKHNNAEPVKTMLETIRKLLSDTGYNSPRNVIQYYNLSQTISDELSTLSAQPNEWQYFDLWQNPSSALNKQYTSHAIHSKQFLKVKFRADEYNLFVKLIGILQHTQNIEFGYYTRPNESYTVILCIKRQKDAMQYIVIANRIVRRIVAVVHKSWSSNDCRYVLIAKFLLYYVFQQRECDITSIDADTCTLCLDGRKAKADALKTMIKIAEKHNANNMLPHISNDSIQEVKYMKEYIEKTSQRHISLVIPASIQVLHQEKPEQFHEFDGIIINPTRQSIVFLEAKNTKSGDKAAQQLSTALSQFNILTQVHKDKRQAYANWCFNPNGVV